MFGGMNHGIPTYLVGIPCFRHPFAKLRRLIATTGFSIARVVFLIAEKGNTIATFRQVVTSRGFPIAEIGFVIVSSGHVLHSPAL